MQQDWQSLWHDLYSPIPSPAKSQLTELTATFTGMVRARAQESGRLTGQGVAALGEGLAAVMFNPDTADDQSVVSDECCSLCTLFWALFFSFLFLSFFVFVFRFIFFC